MDAAPRNRWTAFGNDIRYASGSFVTVTPDDIAELKRSAAVSPRGRCRLCLHEDSAAPLHDMVIALRQGVYDRPHRHLAKAETLVALEGEAICVRYAQDGQPTAWQSLSATGSNSARILRMPIGEFHGLLIVSEWFVFCESTLGPFDATASEAAPWSPGYEDQAAVEQFLAGLNKWVEARA